MPDDLVLANSLDQRPTQWLWRDRIPRGALTLLDGNPATNKSAILCDVTARVSTGRPMFGSDLRHAPAHVILLEGEDPGDEIRRRLVASGADTDRVLTIDRLGMNPPEFPRDIEWLERFIRQYQVIFVAVMPAMRFITASASSYGAIQRALAPLVAMAERTGCAIVLGRHLNRSGGSNPLHRGMGSMGIIGTARAGLLVAPDPADPQRRVFAQTKSNVNALPESLSFRPVDRGGSVAIEWLGVSHFSATALLEATSGESRSALNEAMRFLYSILADGPVMAREVQTLAAQEHIAVSALRRARESLGIALDRVGFGRNGRSWWRLPDDDATWAPLRERMEAEMAANGWRYEYNSVRYDENAGPDDDGAAPDQRGAGAIGGVRPSADVAPSGGHLDATTSPRRAILRRQMRRPDQPTSPPNPL